MRRERKLKPMYKPPEGMMLFHRESVPIYDIENAMRNIMRWHDERGKNAPSHYSRDPSYNWAEEVKAKRTKK